MEAISVTRLAVLSTIPPTFVSERVSTEDWKEGTAQQFQQRFFGRLKSFIYSVQINRSKISGSKLLVYRFCLTIYLAPKFFFFLWGYGILILICGKTLNILSVLVMAEMKVDVTDSWPESLPLVVRSFEVPWLCVDIIGRLARNQKWRVEWDVSCWGRESRRKTRV